MRWKDELGLSQHERNFENDISFFVVYVVYLGCDTAKYLFANRKNTFSVRLLIARAHFYIVPILDNLVKNTSSIMENGTSSYQSEFSTVEV